MVETSSYGASGVVTLGTERRVAPSASRVILAPSRSRREVIVTTSASLGTLSSTIDCAVSRLAAMAGSAAFLAALASTRPRSGTPPSITSRAGISSSSVASPRP